MKKILSLLLILLIATPIMAAEKKAKPVKGKVVSITAEAITLKVKKEDKEFKITDDTKILDKDGAEVAAADAKFKMASVKTSADDATVATEIKEAAAAGQKKGKKEKKEKKDKK